MLLAFEFYCLFLGRKRDLVFLAKIPNRTFVALNNPYYAAWIMPASALKALCSDSQFSNVYHLSEVCEYYPK